MVGGSSLGDCCGTSFDMGGVFSSGLDIVIVSSFLLVISSSDEEIITFTKSYFTSPGNLI